MFKIIISNLSFIDIAHNSEFTQTSDVRDPRPADSGRILTAQYSTWHLLMDVFSSEPQITWYLNWNRGCYIPNRIDAFLLNQKSLGILIGNVGFMFQTGLDQFFALLVPYRSNGLYCAATDRFTSIRGHWCEGRSFLEFPFKICCKTMLIPDYGSRASDVCVNSLIMN